MKPYWSYLKSLLRHKWFVLLAGLKVGGVPLWRLIVHDMSKFSRFEFRQYAVNFHGQESPVDADQVSLDFAYAWLHHENSNPHHWGYWIPRGLSVAIGMIVPQNKRRRVLGYRLDSVQAISGDNLKKSVTIAVTYQ